MGTTLGDTGGQREHYQFMLDLSCTHTKKGIILVFGNQLLLIRECCEALTIVSMSVFELYVALFAT